MPTNHTSRDFSDHALFRARWTVPATNEFPVNSVVSGTPTG